MKNIFKIFMLCVTTVFLASNVFAAGGLSLELVSQNPDPVNPGNFVFVNVKVSNLGSNSVSSAVLSFEETKNFKLAEGESSDLNLGVITGSNSVIKKFKIVVGSDAPLGYNSLNFEIKSSVVLKDSVDILVGSSSSGLNMRSVNTPEVAPGGIVKLGAVLENFKSNSLNDVNVVLGLDQVTSNVFSLNSGTNVKVLGDLEGMSEIDFDFDLIVSPDASSRPYLVPLVVTYKDDLGTEYSNQFYVTVKVFSDPILDIYLNSQSSYSVGKSVFTLAIANPGTSSIKGTTIKILPGDNYNVLSGAVQYVGDLNPDDFQTVQSEVFVLDSSVNNLNVQIKYLDSYNNLVEKTMAIPVNVYGEDELKSLGLVGSSGSSGSGIGSYILMLVLAVIGFFIGKRVERKKHHK